VFLSTIKAGIKPGGSKDKFLPQCPQGGRELRRKQSGEICPPQPKVKQAFLSDKMQRKKIPGQEEKEIKSNLRLEENQTEVEEE